MNKYIFYKLLLIPYCLLTFISCKGRKVNEVYVFHYRDNKLDSFRFNDDKSLKVFNEFLSKKKEVGYKFPTKYFIKFFFTDGTVEEYDCFDALLRSSSVYTIDDVKLKDAYLQIIDSVLGSKR